MLRFILMFLLLFSSVASANNASQYRLGAGDLIHISVYDEPDLSIEVRIGLSGNVSFPLLGDIKVLGLSPKEVESKLLTRLKGPYLIDPSVTVSIVEYRPFYVTGEVEKPGSYAFHPGLTVDKAISIAGGFTERASKSKIFVIHDETEKETRLGSKANGNQIDRMSVKLQAVVQPGDVITVEQSFF